MEIIKDLRTLNALTKKYQLNFDKKYKYCLNCDELTKKFYINQKEYQLKFFDGCFYPYIIKTDRKKATFQTIPTYSNFYKSKNGELYKLTKRLTEGEKNELLQKFFNVEFYEIEPLFAAELKKTAILILYNKNFK